MLKKAALAFGIVFLIIGLGGFVPGLTTKDEAGMPMLLGLFMVGTLHNIIHLGSGAAALLTASDETKARLYFQIFGTVYALVTVIGFIQGDTVLGLFHVNMADNLLHLVISGSSLFLGFGVKPGHSLAESAS